MPRRTSTKWSESRPRHGGREFARLEEFGAALHTSPSGWPDLKPRTAAWEEIVRMEGHNHLMEQCTVGQMRQAIFDMGTSLVKHGLIDDANDVFHISLAELREVATWDAPPDLREIVRASSEQRARRSLLNPPQNLGAEAGPGAGAPVPGAPPSAGFDGQVILGTPASQGVVTGPARLMTSSEPPEAIQRGDVVVAENVGPNMTPYFPLLGGLVLDAGALYQHAALVAREYHLPTVILTRDATTTVHEGETITVDGTRGFVELDR